MKVEEDEESDPANSGNHRNVLDVVGEGRPTDGVPFWALRRMFATGKAVKVEVLLVIICAAQVFPLLKRLGTTGIDYIEFEMGSEA